jgi:membrane associated rhomboid family serine protease
VPTVVGADLAQRFAARRRIITSDPLETTFPRECSTHKYTLLLALAGIAAATGATAVARSGLKKHPYLGALIVIGAFCVAVAVLISMQSVRR